VLVVAGGGYFGYQQLLGGSGGTPKALPPCPAPSPTTPVTEQATLVVKNATLTSGLASDVAKQLRHRDFKIGPVGNTLFRGKGVATVDYSADLAEPAQLVAAQFDGATLDEVTGHNVLEVDVGPRFKALVPRAQAEQAEQDIVGTPTPTQIPTAVPTCAASPR
jgi:hypothetical protein